MFDKESLKLETPTDALENAGIDRSTMKKKKRYQELAREDDDPHSPSLTCVCDIFIGADRMSYQARKPIENDEQRRHASAIASAT